MTELNKIVSQLKSAANELLGNVAAIDKQIAELAQQRDALTSGVVSKADFLEYMRAYFQRQGSVLQREIVNSLKDARDFARLERKHESLTTFNGAWLLTGHMVPVPVTESALYFYFADTMIERLSLALDDLEWPADAVPVELRRAQIENIKLETDSLLKQRAELVAMLADAGITGA
jgi:hypothetical protein